MAETLKKAVLDVMTGETHLVDYTEEELAQRAIDIAEFEARMAEETAKREEQETLKASGRAKLIAGQPLTEEEITALGL